jgi:hypothetical protein
LRPTPLRSRNTQSTCPDHPSTQESHGGDRQSCTLACFSRDDASTRLGTCGRQITPMLRFSVMCADSDRNAWRLWFERTKERSDDAIPCALMREQCAESGKKRSQTNDHLSTKAHATEVHNCHLPAANMSTPNQHCSPLICQSKNKQTRNHVLGRVIECLKRSVLTRLFALPSCVAFRSCE